MEHAAAVLALALALDFLVGEYPSALHPVVWMGRCISWLEARAPEKGRLPQFAWGALTALLVPALFAGGAIGFLAATRWLGWAGVPLQALALKSTFALRELGKAGDRVREALQRDDLAAAREGLRSLCSRDPSELAAPQVAAAAIESLAENSSDSLVAPVLWYVLLGLPGAFAYRAANTLDARIGYRGHYEWLGKAAARLDDLWNLLPARLTAWLLLCAGAFLGADTRRGLGILRRDRHQTESPNAGHPMAAMAGLLGVELEKVGHYRLGDPLEPLDAPRIELAWRLVSLAALIAVGLSLMALGVSHGL